MATFDAALPFVLDNEGFYSNDPGDSGGETWRGISRNNFPNWDGWAIVDAHRNDPDFPECLKDIPVLADKVSKFYLTNFWNPIQGNKIQSQPVATRVLDAAVNDGVSEGVRQIQRAAKVMDDGRVGPQTIGAINACTPDYLLARFRAQRAIFYSQVFGRNPQRYARFLTSWQTRATA